MSITFCQIKLFYNTTPTTTFQPSIDSLSGNLKSWIMAERLTRDKTSKDAAIMVYIQRETDDILGEYRNGNDRLCTTIWNMWLKIEGDEIEPIAAFVRRTPELNKLGNKVGESVATRVAVQLHIWDLMNKQQISEDEAKEAVEAFRSQRTSATRKSLVRKMGNAFMGMVSRSKESSTSPETKMKLIDLVAKHRRQSGRYTETPDWDLIGQQLGVTAKQAQQQYLTIRGSVDKESADPIVIEHAGKVGLYQPLERIDWKDTIPVIKKFIEDTSGQYYHQSGPNEYLPDWDKIFQRLQDLGALPSGANKDQCRQAWARYERSR